MFTGPVGPVEVFFFWPEAVLGNFYWSWAIGLPLASSPGKTQLEQHINSPLQLCESIPFILEFTQINVYVLEL